MKAAIIATVFGGVETIEIEAERISITHGDRVLNVKFSRSDGVVSFSTVAAIEGAANLKSLVISPMGLTITKESN